MIEHRPVALLDISLPEPDSQQHENYRKTYNQESLEDLAHSIHEHGQLQNPAVIETEDGKHRIIYGERRVRAHHILAKKSGDKISYFVPCIVYSAGSLTEQQIQDMRLTENIQREDVPPLEEAHYINQLMKNGRTAEDLAATLKMSKRYVYQRRKLVDLHPDAAELLEAGKITLTHCVELCRFGKADQRKCLNRIRTSVHDKESGGHIEVFESVETLRTYIKNSLTLRLKDVPWSLEDPETPGGACVSCKWNTSAKADLFAGLFSSDAPRCTNAKCFNDNLKDGLQQIKHQAEQDNEGVPVHLVSVGYYDSKDTDTISLWNNTTFISDDTEHPCMDKAIGVVVNNYVETYGEKVELQPGQVINFCSSGCQQKCAACTREGVSQNQIELEKLLKKRDNEVTKLASQHVHQFISEVASKGKFTAAMLWALVQTWHMKHDNINDVIWLLTGQKPKDVLPEDLQETIKNKNYGFRDDFWVWVQEYILGIKKVKDVMAIVIRRSFEQFTSGNFYGDDETVWMASTGQDFTILNNKWIKAANKEFKADIERLQQLVEAENAEKEQPADVSAKVQTADEIIGGEGAEDLAAMLDGMEDQETVE